MLFGDFRRVRGKEVLPTTRGRGREKARIILFSGNTAKGMQVTF